MLIQPVEFNTTNCENVGVPATTLVRSYSKEINSWDGIVSGPTGSFKVTVKSVSGLFDKCVERKIALKA